MVVKLTPLLYEKLWLKYAYHNYPVSPLKILNFLNKSQYWSREQIEEYQINKLKELLIFAKTKSSYYQHMLADINIVNLKLEDIKTLPLLDKETIQNRSNEFITSNIRPFMSETSGSTGIPLKVFFDYTTSAFRIAGRYRQYSWWGIRPGDRSALIWGHKLTTPQKNIVKRVKNSIVDLIYKINVFALNNNTIEKYFNELIEFKPVFIRGYVSALLQFSNLIIEKKLHPHKLPLRVIFVTSEILHPNDREHIENVFNCKVANEYGSSDGGNFAQECPNGGMHIQEESVFGWTNDNNEWIITEYHNFLMPMVNYQINDRVFLSKCGCSCGRGLRVIDRIEGRSGDMILKPDGDYLSQYTIYYIFEELNDVGFGDAIKKYRVVQSKNTFTVYVVKSSNYSPDAIKYIEVQMYKKIGDSINIEFVFVDEIKREKSGKLRFFIRESS